MMSLHPSLPLPASAQPVCLSPLCSHNHSKLNSHLRRGAPDYAPTPCSLQGNRAHRVTDPKVTVFCADRLKT